MATASPLRRRYQCSAHPRRSARGLGILVPGARRVAGGGERHATLGPVTIRRSLSEAARQGTRWEGLARYQVLGYPFVLRWNWAAGADYLGYVLGAFRDSDDGSGQLPTYSLVDAGARGDGARYGVLLGDQQMVASDRAGDIVAHVLWHVFTRALEQTSDRLLIHAGSVVSPSGQGVLLPADAGSGKTTLSVALLRSGFGFLSDEAGVIDPATRLAHPYPRAVNLKEGSWALFDDLPPPRFGPEWSAQFRFVRPEDIRVGSPSAPAPVRLIVAPRYVSRAPTTLTPLRRAEAVVMIAENLMNLPAFGPSALPLLADIAREAPAYRLVSGDLGQAVSAVTDLCEGLGSD